MSTEIKFRAWRPDNKKIHQPATLDELRHKYGQMNWEGLVWMQYTGKTDYNNEELYQQDIVEIPGTGRCVIDICPDYGVVAIDSDGDACPLIDHIFEGDKPVKIGNVFENPELLTPDTAA